MEEAERKRHAPGAAGGPSALAHAALAGLCAGAGGDGEVALRRSRRRPDEEVRGAACVGSSSTCNSSPSSMLVSWRKSEGRVKNDFDPATCTHPHHNTSKVASAYARVWRGRGASRPQ